jgi:DNA invertase Pin-like site-specific DNA recombinase
MKVAIYCRLSEEDRNKANKDDDSNSIKNQKAMLMQYAISQGWDLFDIYSDDDYAGSDRNRPQFKRLLADAQAHKFDIILCKTQSRFTRELELVEKYIHGLFPIWGIRFVSIVDNADTDNKGNKKSRQINGLVNEWYLEDMSENIRSVLTSRRENGFHIGAFAPYGYAKDPDVKGHLIIDEEAAAVVREIFNMFADGYGKTTIARILNERGLPNPTEYKRQKGLRYKQPPGRTAMLWKYTSISDILVNEVYIGNLVQGKYESISYKTRQNRPCPKDRWIRVEGTHEPIIDRMLWNRVQKKAKSHCKGNKQTGKVHLFSGIAVCMHCGCKLRIHKCHGHLYLQCETKMISKQACPGAFIPEAELKSLVINELRCLNQQLLDQSRVQREISFEDSLKSQKERIASDRKGYQEKVDELEFALRQLYIDKTKGLIDARDFFLMSEGFQEEKTKYEALVRSCNERIADIESRIRIGDNRLELLEQYVANDHLSRNMLEILVDHIEVSKRDKASKQVPVTIHWNF